MTWTTPRTWVVQDVLTSADMNTYVAQNLAHIYDRWGTNAPHTWVDYLGGALQSSTGTNVAATFDHVVQQTPASDPMWVQAVSASNIVVKQPGRYAVGGRLEWTDAAGGDRQMRLNWNTTLVAIQVLPERSGSGSTGHIGSVPAIRAAVNDYFQLRHVSTVATTITNQPYYGCSLSASMLGE